MRLKNLLTGMKQQVPRDSAVGDVNVVMAGPLVSSQFKNIAFVCVADDGKSSYATIRKVAIPLMKQLSQIYYNGSCKIAVPISGLILPALSPYDICRIFYSTCKEAAQNLIDFSLEFFTKDPTIFASLDRKPLQIEGSIVAEALRCSIISAKQNQWIRELANADEFYFSLAVAKYKEFLDFSYPDRNHFFKNLLERFIASKLTFQQYMKDSAGTSDSYRFLKICGELVAYIDKNAYNKNLWNQYPDKRTIAKSNVRQTAWIINLLAFADAGFDKGVLSPSIKNAILYLESPSNQLTVLSENHRSALHTAIYGSVHISLDLEGIFGYFRQLEIPIRNPDNTGALYSRILYLPEIKELWLNLEEEPDADSEEAATEDPASDATVNHATVNGDPETVSPASGATTARPRERSIQATIHSDLFSNEDLLNYNAYARSISQFIAHDNTKPPLTVGILAPWGKGKTTLMKLIQKNLQEIAKNVPVPEEEKEEEEVQTTYALFKKYLDKDTRDLMLMNVRKLRLPTIWFNAWNFQKNEQVWAGFAHEIITQLIGQLPNKLQQEKAWLALNLRRIDRAKLRAKMHKTLLNRFIPAIGIALLCIVAFFFSNPLGPDIAKILIATPLLAAGVLGAFIYNKFKTAKLDFDLYKYVKQPNYEEKLGALHLIKEDLRLALNLLVDPQKPAVIFIDDLDRCSPATTAELVEAINSFISGDLPHCYFILGQDAQMVAASLDVSYKDVGDKLGNLQSGYGSLGWFFMEKFMQLQFNIPIMQKADSKRILSSLLRHIDKEEQPIPTLSKQEVKRKAEEILQEADSSDNEIALQIKVSNIEEQLLQVEPAKLKEIRNKIVDKAAEKYTDEDVEVTSLIEEFSEHLTTSPRMVKRFVNLYRFHRFIQFTGQNKDLLYTDAQTIARWIIIMIKWPQLVRAIQWDAEKDFQNGAGPMERAGNFEQTILSSPTYEEWQTSIAEKYKGGILWLSDRGLYDFLKTNSSEEASLSTAVECRFW